jgi:hypothetical protein
LNSDTVEGSKKKEILLLTACCYCRLHRFARAIGGSLRLLKHIAFQNFPFAALQIKSVTPKPSRGRMMQPLSWQCLMILVTLFSLIACSASKRRMPNEPQQRKNLRTRSRFDDIAHSTSHQKERRTIVGGTPANPNRFPAIVFLSDRENQLSCGGTLISPTVVLTAAHCEV